MEDKCKTRNCLVIINKASEGFSFLAIYLNTLILEKIHLLNRTLHLNFLLFFVLFSLTLSPEDNN